MIEQPGQGRVLLVRRARLEVVEGPDRGRLVELTSDPLVAGSAEECGMRLSDPAVSARHLELQATERGFSVRDLDSTNGTFCRGVRLQQAYLLGPASLTLGRTELSFEVLDDEVAVPLSPRSRFGGLIGHSDAMRAVFSVLERVAASDTTQLIEGESGTGKELAALLPSAADPREMPLDAPFHLGRRAVVERFERRYLSHLFERAGGNVAEMARATCLSLQTCYRLLKRYDLG